MPLYLSHSAVKKFRRCKRQFKYSLIDGLEPRLTDEKIKFGNWFHTVLQAHYEGEDWMKAHKRETKKFNNLFLEEREYYGDMPELVERMMRSYLWRYGKQEQDWEVLYVETEWEVHFEEEDVFTFKPDLIVRDHSTKEKAIWVVDHKTTRTIPSAEWRIEDLQSTIYPYALRETTDLNVKGFIFNYIRRKAPSIPRINKDGSISRRRIDTDYPTMARFLIEYFEVENVNQLPMDWKKRLKNLRLEDKFFKRSKIIKADALVNRQMDEFTYTAQEIEVWLEMHDDGDPVDPWVRTMLPSCEWDCEFHDICVAELLGQDTKFMRRAKYKPSTYAQRVNIGRNR